MSTDQALTRSFASESTLRQILDAVPELVLVKGPDSRIVWANAAFRALYGMTSEELQGLIDAPINKPDHTQKYAVDDAQVFATGRPMELPNEPVMRFDGQERRVDTVKTPIFDEAGNVVLLVAVCHDITDRNRLEARLRLADHMASVGTLAAGVAHEINTPVQFVSDSLHFLRDATRDIFALLETFESLRSLVGADAPAAELQAAASRAAEAADEADVPYLRENVPLAIERCLDGLERVSIIVRSMKEFTHPAQAEMAPVDLNRAILNTLTIARNEYKYVADLETDMAELPAVTCYVNEINQVVLNLVVNAANAIGEAVAGSESKGLLRVWTRQEGPDALIYVSDTGIGIPEINAHRVFEQFFTTKAVGEGTGQGLSLAWSVVHDKHGGDLSFESTVGVGTTFVVRLPIAGRLSQSPLRLAG